MSNKCAKELESCLVNLDEDMKVLFSINDDKLVMGVALRALSNDINILLNSLHSYYNDRFWDRSSIPLNFRRVINLIGKYNSSGDFYSFYTEHMTELNEITLEIVYKERDNMGEVNL